MFEDYSERLFAHYVTGRWRAPFASTALPVRLPDGRVPGQIVPAGPRDVARAVAARDGADEAAIARAAHTVEAAQETLAQASALQSGRAPDLAASLALAEGLRSQWLAPADVLLSASNTDPGQIGAALGAGLRQGVIWCPPPDQAIFATTLATVFQQADLPPGAFALLHARVDPTEAALRMSGLQCLLL